MINVNVTGIEDVTVVEVEGRIDSMNANQLGEALSGEIDSGKNQIVLDLAGVDYMSSAGLREIVNALKKVKPSGDVRISEPTERVREVLDMAGLSTILQIFNSKNDALASY